MDDIQCGSMESLSHATQDTCHVSCYVRGLRMWVGSERKDVRKYVLAVNYYILYKWAKKETLCSAASNTIYRAKEQVGSVYVEFHYSTAALLVRGYDQFLPNLKHFRGNKKHVRLLKSLSLL